MRHTSQMPLGLAVALSATACAYDIQGEEPPEQAFYFPIGLTATSNQEHLLVVNSNFDQRYNAGWLSVVSLVKLAEEIDARNCAESCAPGSACVVSGNGAKCLTEQPDDECPTCSDYEVCTADGSDSQCRQRPDFSAAITQQLRIPSLAGKIALAGDDSLAVVTARGEQPLTVVEVGAGCEEFVGGDCLVHCGDAEDTEGLTAAWQRTDCDREHLTKLEVADARTDEQKAADAESGELVPPNKTNQAFVAEDRMFEPDTEDRLAVSESEISDPFGVHVFERPGSDKLNVAVGYLGGTSPSGSLGRGFVSVLEVENEFLLRHERLLGPFAAFIGKVTTYPGATDIPYMVATSHLGGVTQQDRLIDWSALYDIDLERAFDSQRDYFRVHQIGINFGGYEIADIVFSREQNRAPRAYVANRDPDSIVVIDTELETRVDFDPERQTFVEREVVRYLPVAATVMPGEPSGLVYISRPNKGDLLAAVAFNDDALFFLSVAGDRLRVDRRIDRVGQGPYDLVQVRRGGRDLLLVTAFFDHAIAIVDITADDPQQFQLLGHLRNPNSVSSADRAR